ncbi:MAG: transketolase [Actinobacteria bacterium]|uniref:transketolase n=1 Tax=freshwater metagenome TaxID=449393 RepID=A0A6J6AL33_9ZZZZ|nr:transketolase [Actinomycetota bacterium]MTB21466.1 transketolase [Actinomycetota bacterium]
MSTIANWSKEDDLVIAHARALAMDAVQKVGNGHPGTAMSLAPVAYLLFQRHLIHDPSDPKWIGRDRFILSCGHSSMTLYTQLFLSGYGLELKDLQEFRTWGSLTPGHPEFAHTAGVEMTTGPLGQGVSTAVGMAMAARFERGLFDPLTIDGSSLFDHNVWVICSDGDLQEGISSEAGSFAGTQALGNLNVIYDDNRISIEGDTHVTFTEDVSARYRAYGWEVIEVPALSNGDVDLVNLDKAMTQAAANLKQPTMIRLKTVIAWPAPHAQGTAKSHGSALGAEEIAATKTELGLNPVEHFAFPQNLLDHARLVKERGAVARGQWDKKFDSWKNAQPDRAKTLSRVLSQQLPSDWDSLIPHFEAGKEIATRKASGDVINALAQKLPEMWGGSADLAESNNTTIEGGGSFLPESSSMKNANPYGRIIHFGIREHAMGSMLNGIALSGLTKAFAGTFAVFSDYMRPAVRLAALMKLPSTFVWTHDSIGLGEDGPTHQPVEHFAALRAIPGLDVIRPADANEVTAAWRVIIQRRNACGILLSRQNLPVFDRTQYGSLDGVARGAYILKEASSTPQVILMATGSEVSLAVTSAQALEASGIPTRVVSVPCFEWFNEQTQAYKDEVLPPSIKARVSIEAGIAQGWRDYVGDNGASISLEHYGASASANVLFKEFGFTVENVIATVKKVLS